MIRALLFDLSYVLVVGLTGVEARLQAYLPYPGDEILRQLRSDAIVREQRQFKCKLREYSIAIW
jgi:hypothetical protein